MIFHARVSEDGKSLDALTTSFSQDGNMCILAYDKAGDTLEIAHAMHPEKETPVAGLEDCIITLSINVSYTRADDDEGGLFADGERASSGVILESHGTSLKNAISSFRLDTTVPAWHIIQIGNIPMSSCCECGRVLIITCHGEINDVSVGAGPPVHLTGGTIGHTCHDCFHTMVEQDVEDYMQHVMEKDD